MEMGLCKFPMCTLREFSCQLLSLLYILVVDNYHLIVDKSKCTNCLRLPGHVQNEGRFYEQFSKSLRFFIYGFLCLI